MSVKTSEYKSWIMAAWEIFNNTEQERTKITRSGGRYNMKIKKRPARLHLLAPPPPSSPPPLSPPHCVGQSQCGAGGSESSLTRWWRMHGAFSLTTVRVDCRLGLGCGGARRQTPASYRESRYLIRTYLFWHPILHGLWSITLGLCIDHALMHFQLMDRRREGAGRLHS